MAKEIEYKFLGNALTLHAALSRNAVPSTIYQGYLTEASFTVQVRLDKSTGAGITLTSAPRKPLKCFNYAIPMEDALQMAVPDSPDWLTYQKDLSSGELTTRVRLLKDTKTAYLTLKSKSKGISRDEFEYEIPYEDAVRMTETDEVFGLDKVRYGVDYNGFLFEIDVYLGILQGLVTVEVEVPDESTEIRLPAWVGEDISQDFRYTNVQLARNGIPMS